MTEMNEAPRVASPPGDGAEPLLKLRGIDKHFGPAQALYGVNLDLFAGNVTGLCGDNGAGKSVLTRTIAGAHHPDHGQIYFEGRPVHIRSTRDAAALGIETVYQDLALADNLDIVQNMFLGRERLRRGLLDEASMERQAVAVAKAVMWNSKVVLLDEPTAALGVVQTRTVLDLIEQLRDHGLAVMVISHNLNDVFAVADRLAVLHLGHLAAQGPIAEFDTQRAVELITTGRMSKNTKG